jgi:septal ring factor EnvC (AmiA/AmiB activator)
VIKPVVAKKYQPSAQEKSISKLQDQLNRHFDQSKKTEDILKQIERKMAQIDKIIIVSNKQHEIIRKMQVQFNNIRRTLTKIDKSITSLRSRSVPKPKPSVKVDKKSRNKSKKLNRKGSRKK